jgi:hypothetical protein
MKTATTKQQKSSQECIISDAMQRFPESASVGDTVRQGDLYFMLIDSVPLGCVRIKKPSSQLAPGTTQGSRHCLSSIDGVECYSLKEPTVYDGPVLVVNQEVTVTHPEHGDWLLPCGIYAVTYQRTEDSEGRQRRVQD